jgi:radical SAM superfamily enzyme YgiQ (UPF0313 family)
MIPLNYDEPVFRPPSEAYSLIFQVTLGCAWNKCAFCDMYKSKQFRARKETDVLEEIRMASGYYQGVRKIFLADGNALVLSTDRLLTILKTIKTSFPSVGRISTYALPKDVLAKPMAQLVALREAGLQLIYVGIESGDEEVLRMVNKCESVNSTMEGLQKAHEAGIKSSVMIVNGLAGQKYSYQHAVNSALLLNKIQPLYFSTLVLMLPYGEEQYKEAFNGTYIHMNRAELLKEMKLLIENTKLERTIFRSDHASNFLALKGVLGRDKEKLLNTIKRNVS